MMVFLLFFMSTAQAQKSNVMDFEADVIEGELRRPDLFLQLGNDHMNVESISYGRSNFNDFNKADRFWRVRYFELKRADTKKADQKP